jgi:hypothetical protein
MCFEGAWKAIYVHDVLGWAATATAMPAAATTTTVRPPPPPPPRRRLETQYVSSPSLLLFIIFYCLPYRLRVRDSYCQYPPRVSHGGFFNSFFSFSFFSVFTDYTYGTCHSHYQLPAFQVVVFYI